MTNARRCKQNSQRLVIQCFSYVQIKIIMGPAPGPCACFDHDSSKLKKKYVVAGVPKLCTLRVKNNFGLGVSLH